MPALSNATPNNRKGCDTESSPMKETIVARKSLVPAVLGVVAVLVIFAGVASALPFVRAVLVLGFGAFFARKLFLRVARMRLAVTDDNVIVVNLDERVELDLETVSIDTRRSRGRWWFTQYVVHPVRSAMDADYQPARVLCLSDAHGQSASVDVAPRYGSGLDTVAEDLVSAIEEKRLAA